jgi:predicted neutral ceramidase superfamily lipid hydrolase
LTYLHSEQPGMAALLADAGLLSVHDFRGTFLEDEKLRRKRKSEAFSRRLFMAAFGGAALIAPMLIMTLHPTKVTNLVMASAFVMVVAVLLAYVMTEATPQDIIGATAAYAAVLVVFVGSSAPSQ